MPSSEEAIGAVFQRWARRTRAPGVAWGLVRGGELEASGGIGTLRVGDDAPPDADSVFRIASMTKSFTGAALMRLVVDGRLRLDDPVTVHVPELSTWRGPTVDGPPITVRHLASMETGLPTDDEWADRHMDLTETQFAELIAAGGAFAWPPGTRFEYSNLGWGLLGRVMRRVAGVRAQELVTSSLIGPLGLAATTWTRPSSGVVAEPYRIQDREWRHEGEPVGDGELAPMGGLWSSVRDLARWVAFFTDAFPPRDEGDEAPLPRWARREMQQLRRFDELTRLRPSPSGPARMTATGYGIGLGIRIDERLGVSVGHSGGLPGYGSHMRWLPDHGIGVVGLANVTYGNMHLACIEALEVLAHIEGVGPADPVASAELVRASERTASLLSSWDDADADALFADVVGLDEAYEHRAARTSDLIGRHGPLRVGSVDAETPRRGSFTAADGLVRVEIALSHEDRVQWLDVEDRLEPSGAPMIVDDAGLHDARGTAYLVVRPVGDLAAAFVRWQGEVLDRLGGAPAVVPGAHATLKGFGSASAPLTPEDEERIGEVVSAWTGAQAPIELRADALHLFEDIRVPVVRLEMTDSFRTAFRGLRAAASAAWLPAGPGDEIGNDEWIPHLSLAYPRGVDRARWEELGAWARGVDAGAIECVALEAELIAYDGGPERRLGRFAFGAA
ncbi:MAG TPA: serine hydrolase [Actinomycetota bacterium]|nr:serine hydrolase [Actinomycetota bacterium]